MCEPELLQSLKHLQIKAQQLKCTLNSDCWCNLLSYRFPLAQADEQCMSPIEILNLEKDLSNSDKKYLEFLSHKEFIRQ
jgi:hypothetical protein